MPARLGTVSVKSLESQSVPAGHRPSEPIRGAVDPRHKMHAPNELCPRVKREPPAAAIRNEDRVPLGANSPVHLQELSRTLSFTAEGSQGVPGRTEDVDNLSTAIRDQEPTVIEDSP